jgi:hypothetical protein
MGLVVRCPACRGTAGIDAAAQGHTVRCPRCDAAFVAVPEAELVAPRRPKRNPTLPTRPDRPIEPESPQLPPSDEVSSSREADHDPHRHPAGGLPASVLMGLALLPFAIPILWLTAPAIFGQPPLLSIAVPLAIAVSASILSLAVIYTIDWSPAVRVKGVLMLLGLAYFSAVSLYFLKKEMVEWVKTNFDKPWTTFTPPNSHGEYKVKMPQPPSKDANYRPIPDIPLECYTLSHNDELGNLVTFVVGAGTPQAGAKGSEPGTEQWFDSTTDSIIVESQGQLDPDQQTKVTGPQADAPNGRELRINLGDGKTMRIVRVFFIKGRVYYLSIEGADLNPEDATARRFFNSFDIPGRKK